MKKILFFENSPLLQKAIQLILSNNHIYEITIVDSLTKFEKENHIRVFDLIISHIDLIKMHTKNKNFDFQKFLLMYEKFDSIKEFKDMNFIHFIEKPFTSEELKKKIDFILGVHEKDIKISNNKVTDDKLNQHAKDAVEKWLREEAPKFAKEVIRDEILKLIS
ncbi:hypothetical protein [Silvanigrella aquatica]|uniref:Response regulatory domain-containing protein n=1 Tax=Silvanigrella aquatica TaxID=1915309 RepID=A0A1L4CYP4_9BACT|nr:hypothetical protein [Silvanigrella aquatica]APJ03074.1 hypothetical protein AXG55_03770 [Silvanigrella aquatica]